jgi:heptosyltransferase-2
MTKSLNILVVLPNPMGDAILSGVALRRLRKALPEAWITYLCSPSGREVLDRNPWCDEWLVYPKTALKRYPRSIIRHIKEKRFDAAILLPNSFCSAGLVFWAGIPKRIGYDRDARGFMLTQRVKPFRLVGRYMPVSMIEYYLYLIERAAENLGGKPPAFSAEEKKLELFVSKQNRAEADGLLSQWGIKKAKLAIMVPGGAFGPSKYWPAERFARLADKLKGDGYEVILSCAPNDAERHIAAQIRRAARTRLYDLAEKSATLGTQKALIRRCRLMIANDMGPCHMAKALNVPLATIYGPTDPRWTATGYEKEIRILTDEACGPCQLKICPMEYHCIDNITVEDVYRATRYFQNNPEVTPTIEPQPRKGLWYLQPQKFEHPCGTYYAPFRESYLPLKDGLGVMLESYRGVLEKYNLTSVADVFQFQAGEMLTKPGLGRRERIRLRLRLEDGRQVAVYLKRFYGGDPLAVIKQPLCRRGQKDSAVSDFDGAMMLAEKNIPVARPIAFGEKNGKIGEKRGFVMFEGLPHGDALERILPEWEAKKKEYALLRDKKKLIEALADLALRLHGAGFYHRDFYLAHIFLCKDREEREKLCLIDYQRVFRPQINKRRWQVKDLAQLYYSAQNFFSRHDGYRFLLRYFGCQRLTGGHKRIVRALIRKAERIARHDAKKKAKERA